MTLAGTVETASLEPQRVRARFTGRSVALMARTGPGMGKVKVFVDGKRVAIVDLDRANVSERKLVWAKNWSRVAEHGISVKPVTTTDRVDFNGFFLLR
jgi:hypothetical protein